MSVCLRVCLSVRAVKRKRLELSTGNSIEPKFHGRSSACIDPEVKRPMLRSGLRFQFWLGLGWVKAGVDLHVDTTAHFLVLFVSLSCALLFLAGPHFEHAEAWAHIDFNAAPVLCCCIHVHVHSCLLSVHLLLWVNLLLLDNFSCMFLTLPISTPCPEKNGTNNILGITLTKFNKFPQLLAQFMLTFQLTTVASKFARFKYG